jgi:hypothetical protein
MSDGPTLFDGETFDPALDGARLTGQLARVYELMSDGAWRTLRDIARDAGGTEAAVSARLRDLRKARFGGHTVERRRVPGASGLWEYRVGRGRVTGQDAGAD